MTKSATVRSHWIGLAFSYMTAQYDACRSFDLSGWYTYLLPTGRNKSRDASEVSLNEVRIGGEVAIVP